MPREALEEEPQDENNEPNETPVTQAARERAERLGVDLDSIEGTGVDGRIVVKDVIEASRK
jgi:pyruvate/2-oxoglutarate dehydrogenase complex dihydrolipoamide acyltransferase (E2) component